MKAEHEATSGNGDIVRDIGDARNARDARDAYLRSDMDESWIDVEANRLQAASIFINTSTIGDTSTMSTLGTGNHRFKAAKTSLSISPSPYVDIDEGDLSGESLVLPSEYYSQYDVDGDDEYDSNIDEDMTAGKSAVVLRHGYQGPPSSGSSSIRHSSSADADLRASLSTLLNQGADTGRTSKSPGLSYKSSYEDDIAGAHSTHPRTNSRVQINTVRIVSETELQRRRPPAKSSSNSSLDTAVKPVARFFEESDQDLVIPSVAEARKRTKRKARNRAVSKSTTPITSSIDLGTVTLAAAGLSLVAGLSFSAGYALGRRSGVHLAVASG